MELNIEEQQKQMDRLLRKQRSFFRKASLERNVDKDWRNCSEVKCIRKTCRKKLPKKDMTQIRKNKYLCEDCLSVFRGKIMEQL